MSIVIKRLVVTFVFLIVAISILNMAPEYDLEYKYKEGDIRVIFDDVEITRNLSKLPQTAILVDNQIMLSQDTVDILFDKNLYYEDKYQTLITTTNSHRADLKLNSKVMRVDDGSRNLEVPPLSIRYNYYEDDRYTEDAIEKKNNNEEIIYIPIQALEDVYDMTVEFKDKVIITQNNKNRIRLTVNENDTIELKHTADNFSKNVEIIESGSYIDIYNYDESKEFIFARSYTGELGYISKEDIKLYSMIPITSVKEKEKKEKLNIAWDYIGPDATSIGDKNQKNKYEALDVVAPTLLYLKNPTGEIKYNNSLVSNYMKWANDKGYRVWVALKNEYASKHFSLDETSEFLNDMYHREKAIDSIIKFLKEYNIEGINVDIELIYQEDATAFSQFVRELCVKAHQENKIVSVCVNVPDGSPNWSLCYQHKALSERADYIALVAYDQYGASSNKAGPNASLEWVSTNVEKLVKRDSVESEKILLGIPFYSRLWTSNNGVVKSKTLTMNSAKSYLNKNPMPIWSEEAGQYFYESKDRTTLVYLEENKSIIEKLKLIEKYNLGGSAYWMLGYETEDIWQTISQTLNY